MSLSVVYQIRSRVVLVVVLAISIASATFVFSARPLRGQQVLRRT
jgi:hypothetical protein